MRNGMKRFFAGTLAMMMLFAMTGCRSKAQTLGVEEKEAMAPIETTTPIEHIDIETGGWSAAESTELTDGQRSLFEKALEGLTGVVYEPVAYLGSQAEAGLICFLCRATVVYPDAQPAYKLVYLCEDTDGNVSILDIADFANADGEALAGGWFASDDIALPEEVKEAYDKAMEGLVGVDYEPVAFLESQVVAGMNYRILCKSTVVYPGAETGYAIVTVYRALDGSAEVTDIADVALGVRAEK